MCFPKNKTKRISDLARNVAPTQETLLIVRATMFDVFLSWRKGEEVSIVHGDSIKRISTIHDTGYQYIVRFDDRLSRIESRDKVLLKLVGEVTK